MGQLLSKVTVKSYLRQVGPWLVLVWSTKRVEQFHAPQSRRARVCVCLWSLPYQLPICACATATLLGQTARNALPETFSLFSIQMV